MDDAAAFQPEEAYALELDAADPLRGFRARFHIPSGPDGREAVYLCGNSLGLQPRAAGARVSRVLESWAARGVGGWFRGGSPWYDQDEGLREPLARLVGARREEVTVMNALTVNLHAMLTTFYRPTGARYRILVDEPVFPSDAYALHTHLRTRGMEPAEAILAVGARPGESTPRQEDVEALIAGRGDELALVLVSGVNYLTGQLLDLGRIAAVARRKGCAVGFDLAHAVGNVPLRLHDWGADFAVWCHYKYVNGGPGAPGGCFIHERHLGDASLPRLGGWWGNEPGSRFEMRPTFEPRPEAAGWQISNPPVLSLVPLASALAIFAEAGLDRLRAKSLVLTGYLERVLEWEAGEACRIITPRDRESRGCQLSLRLDRARQTQTRLREAGVICDFREPDVLRLAPVPLYNTFHDVWRAARLLRAAIAH